MLSERSGGGGAGEVGVWGGRRVCREGRAGGIGGPRRKQKVNLAHYLTI